MLERFSLAVSIVGRVRFVVFSFKTLPSRFGCLFGRAALHFVLAEFGLRVEISAAGIAAKLIGVWSGRGWHLSLRPVD